MARGLRDIRRKIKAIKATRQVTKAMELVSASKMRKAVQNAEQLRRFSRASWEVLQRVAQQHPDLHPSLELRPLKRVLAVLYTSDRGLAGSMHTQLFRFLAQYIERVKSTPGFERIDFIAMGKKGQQFLARTQQSMIAAFPGSQRPSVRDILPIARLATDGFKNGTYDHVVLLYPNFVSALVQEPSVRVLLPFSPKALREVMSGIRGKNAVEEKALPPVSAPYLFEPSAEEVVEAMIPQITSMLLYQALLEETASEHSARMVAMRSATDNASGIIDDLTLTYNQTRQANITAELAELSASKAALE